MSEEEQNNTCPRCGAIVKEDNLFCTECGFRLDSITKKRSNSTLIITLAVIFVSLVVVAGIYVYQAYQRQMEIYKAPYTAQFSFADTKASVEATYEPTFKTINLKLIIDETVENWQIEANGSNKANIKLTFQTDDSGNKIIEFKDVALVAGSKIYGNYSIANSELQEFVAMKKLLEDAAYTDFVGAQITCPQPITVDSKKKQQLKQQYLAQKRKEKELNDLSDGLMGLAALMMLGGL